MTPADALAQYRSILAEIGEDIAVRRYNGAGNSRLVAQEAIVRGRVTSLGAKDIVGDIKISDRKVILINDPEAAVPAGTAVVGPAAAADK
jgi:hypothetical protein